jgi:hypothetical protein
MLSVHDGRHGRVDRARRTHLHGQVEPVLVDVGDDHVAGTGVADHRDGHQTDRTRAGDEHVLTEYREGERGVHRVAERVEDRRCRRPARPARRST